MQINTEIPNTINRQMAKKQQLGELFHSLPRQRIKNRLTTSWEYKHPGVHNKVVMGMKNSRPRFHGTGFSQTTQPSFLQDQRNPANPCGLAQVKVSVFVETPFRGKCHPLLSRDAIPTKIETFFPVRSRKFHKFPIQSTDTPTLYRFSIPEEWESC